MKTIKNKFLEYKFKFIQPQLIKFYSFCMNISIFELCSISVLKGLKWIHQSSNAFLWYFLKKVIFMKNRYLLFDIKIYVV